MDYAAFKNPWVIGGGVVLGLIVLMLRSGGSTSDTAAQSGGNFISVYNAGMAEQATAQATIAAGVENNRLQTHVSLAVATMSFLQNLAGVSAAQETQDRQIDAGVTVSRMNAINVMLSAQEDYLAKNAQTYVAGDVANHVSDNELRGVMVQAEAAKYIAKKQASAMKTASIVGGIASLGSSLIGGVSKMFAPVPVAKPA